jgi:glutathione peroxidase
MFRIEEIIDPMTAQAPASIYELSATSIDGESVSFNTYRDKVLLIVNTASQCGFTPQYKGLQALYDQYASQGLVVLGFPCNQFGGQEPGDSEDKNQETQTRFSPSVKRTSEFPSLFFRKSR